MAGGLTTAQAAGAKGTPGNLRITNSVPGLRGVNNITPANAQLLRPGSGAIKSYDAEPPLKKISDPSGTIRNSKEQQSFKGTSFPPDLKEDYITFDFSKYQRPSPNSTATNATELSISFPIPRVLTEQHTLNLTPQSLKTIQTIVGAATDAADAMTNLTATGGFKGFLNSATDLGISAAAQYYSDSGTKFLGFSGEQVVGTLGQVVGVIPNPHMSVFFNGVDLRPAIEFSWLFTPKNANESDLLKSILKDIKKRILPEVSSGAGNAMNYPYMVQPTIHGPDPDMVPLYKKGLISALSINYTPNGPSFFKGTNSPTFIAFSFLFQEIEVFTSKDYGGAEAENFLNRLGDLVPYAKNAIAQEGQNVINATTNAMDRNNI